MKRQKKRYKNQRSAGHDSSGLLTKKDLARRLGRTERTIENWQRTGVLPFLKIHRSVYFFWADVQSHLQKYFHVVRGDEPKSRDTEETGAGSS